MKSIILFLIFTTILTAQDSLFMRTEYDTVGHFIGAVESAQEILPTEDSHWYRLDGETIRVSEEIPDLFDEVTVHTLRVERANDTVTVRVVDGFDYLVSLHEGSILSQHQEIDTAGEWSAYNNLWGKGTAVPNEDFRIVMLLHDTLPESGMILWDVPGKAAEFGGSSVWCYSSFMFGDRLVQREDLERFPFKIEELTELRMDFDYTPILGDDQFKMALNCFLTDEEELSPFSANDGDFFMVFDQVGTWVPPYPVVVVEDTLIEGEPYTLLYNEKEGYEWRRVIIKDHARLQSGSVDLLGLFNRFAERNYIDKRQSIPNIQFGVEVTSGFGAVLMNHLEMTMTKQGETSVSFTPLVKSHVISVQQLGRSIRLTLPQEGKVELLATSGRVIESHSNFTEGVIGENLANALYFIRTKIGSDWVSQKFLVK